jgi:hypothetical protein
MQTHFGPGLRQMPGGMGGHNTVTRSGHSFRAALHSVAATKVRDNLRHSTIFRTQHPSAACAFRMLYGARCILLTAWCTFHAAGAAARAVGSKCKLGRREDSRGASASGRVSDQARCGAPCVRWTGSGRSGSPSHVACCIMLPVACCIVLPVACCMLHYATRCMLHSATRCMLHVALCCPLHVA